MWKKTYAEVTSLALGVTCLASLGGCSPSTSLSSGPEQGTGSIDRLTSHEWTAYVDNAQYLRDLTPPDVAVKLNLADPRQYDFVMARLKLAGKHPDNSPHLFELLEARRQSQIARGMKSGTFAQVLDTAPTGRVAMHYIEQNSIVTRPPQISARTAAPSVNPSPRVVGAASSTFPGGTYDTYVDITISAINGTLIAPLQFKEEFENLQGVPGANVTVSTSGNTNVSSVTRYTAESYEFHDAPDEGFSDSYSHSEVGTQSGQANAIHPDLTPAQILDPKDIVGPNGSPPEGTISVCMDRQWTNDCDYVLNTGSVFDHRIKMPLKGDITIQPLSRYEFDTTAITAIRTALNGGLTDPHQGLLKLVLTNIGGGCDVDKQGALTPSMSSFWNHVTLSANKKTFSWDLTGDNAAFFDEGCTQIQDSAKLTLMIYLPMVPTGSMATYYDSITISNDPATPDVDNPLKKITLTNSCLAAGTQIQLGNGKLAAIESLHIGQKVYNPYAASDHALTIKDTAKGSERSPMVRIRDEAGHTLLVTEMHPIATADHGMVQARALRTGDLVMTRQGASKLVEVSREPYSGQVYNLKVGSEGEMASLGQDQTVVYANGFVVGDGQIQSKYEELALKQGARTGIEQVPEQWRRDYLLSPHHN